MSEPHKNMTCVQLMVNPSLMTGPNGYKVIGSSLAISTKEARHTPLGPDTVKGQLHWAGIMPALHLEHN